MKDLTIFILTSGEESLNECMESVKKQSTHGRAAPHVEIIKDVYPVHEAFNQMHTRCKTDFFIQVDADVILKNDAVVILYEAMKRASFMVYAAYGQLYEEGFGPGGSVRCWRKNVFNIFKFRDVRTTDRDFYKRAILLGLHRKDVKKTLGIHRPRQSDFLDYWKTKGEVEKWQFLGRRFEKYAHGLYKDLIKDPHRNRYKILGFSIGVLTSKERIQRSKNTRVEQERVRSIFNIVRSSFDKFNIGESTNLTYLCNILKKAYRNYSPHEKKDFIKEVIGELYNTRPDEATVENLHQVIAL